MIAEEAPSPVATAEIAVGTPTSTEGVEDAQRRRRRRDGVTAAPPGTTGAEVDPRAPTTDTTTPLRTPPTDAADAPSLRSRPRPDDHAAPGALAPVVDPVTEDVVDPLVDTVDGLVPGLGVGDTVDDSAASSPILGCR